MPSPNSAGPSGVRPTSRLACQWRYCTSCITSPERLLLCGRDLDAARLVRWVSHRNTHTMRARASMALGVLAGAVLRSARWLYSLPHRVYGRLSAHPCARDHTHASAAGYMLDSGRHSRIALGSRMSGKGSRRKPLHSLSTSAPSTNQVFHVVPGDAPQGEEHPLFTCQLPVEEGGSP